MRTLAKLTTGVVVALLTLVGCSGPKSGVSELPVASAAGVDLPAYIEVPELDGGSVRLLAEQDEYAFYAADAAQSGFCLVIVNSEIESDWVAGCTSAKPSRMSPGETPLQVDGPGGVKAKLAVNGYDASKDLAQGWEQLHPNLLVNGL